MRNVVKYIGWRFGFVLLTALIVIVLSAPTLPQNNIDIVENNEQDQSWHDYESQGTRNLHSKILVIEEEVPFVVRTEEDNGMEKGEQRLIQEGRKGVKQISYEIRYDNEQEIDREKIGEIVALDCVDKITKVGTKVVAKKPAENKSIFVGGAEAISRSGETIRYSRMVNASATAYDLVDLGKAQQGVAYTASGRKAARGVVAVDPKVIPLGTRLYIESVDGSWTYGYAVAGDTGGAVKGNVVDLFFDTHKEVINFGRRPAKVYVLE